MSMEARQYTISHKEPLIQVLCGSEIWMEVKQRFSFRTIYSDYYLKEQYILSASFKRSLWSYKLKILEQHTPELLLIGKVNGTYVLEAGRYRLWMSSRQYQNPAYYFYNNGVQIGEVTTKRFSFGEYPVYNCSFYEDSDIALYAIILFVIKLPPTLETF